MEDRMKKCNKCNKDGNVFKKLYDTAIGNRKVVRNKKGQLGIWVRCACNRVKES